MFILRVYVSNIKIKGFNSSVVEYGSFEYPFSIFRKLLQIKMHNSVVLLALLKHTNKQSTMSAVVFENPEISLCSFASNITVYEQPRNF
jgi:hypothetical protein